MKKVLVLGNSEKQRAIAEYLGNEFSVMHFEKAVPKEALEISDAVILPLPANDGEKISGSEIKIGDIFTGGEKIYIGGKFGAAFDPYRKSNLLIDYALRDDFAEKNAQPTAEAAIMLAMQQNPFTISGSKCVISGCGRIGKALLKLLTAFGADVFVLARSAEARQFAAKHGAAAFPFEEAEKIGKADTVFNTVPHCVLNEKELKSLAPRLVLDLASAPGGCDFAAAEALGINAANALALPGKHFPETAAAVAAETILSILN